MAKKVERTSAGLRIRESDDGTWAGSVATGGKTVPTVDPLSTNGNIPELSENRYTQEIDYLPQVAIYRSQIDPLSQDEEPFTSKQAKIEEARRRSMAIRYEGFLGASIEPTSVLVEYDIAPYRLVFHRNEQNLYQVTAFLPKDEMDLRIGFLRWNLDIEDDNLDVSRIDHIEVHPDYRRQGLATLLYREAVRESERLEIPCPIHHEVRTADGDAWAQSLGDIVPEIACGMCGETGHHIGECPTSWDDNYGAYQVPEEGELQ